MYESAMIRLVLENLRNQRHSVGCGYYLVLIGGFRDLGHEPAPGSSNRDMRDDSFCLIAGRVESSRRWEIQ
jgi:hypothetical protein